MADILMSPVISPVAPGAGVDRKAQLPVENTGSFAQHLERKIRGEQPARENLLGVRSNKSKALTTEGDGSTEPPATVEALLQQLMSYLQKMAEEPGAKPGQWTIQPQDAGGLENLAGLAGMDAGVLEKLAALAGMDAGTLALLKKQMEEQGSLPLADLFAALEKNFKELGTVKPVTVAETNLPLLESFLSRLGVAPEVIGQLDTQGVNGLDQLDLTAFLKGLQDLLGQGKGQEGASSTTLTAAEFEQFKAMLAEAGVPADTIETMFPEQVTLQQKALAGLSPQQGNTPIVMSLDRLASILQQALVAVDETRPKVDVPAFLTEMETILSQAGYQSNDVGWSPVVQGAMQDTYDQLQRMIAQEQSREDKTMQITAINDAIQEEWQMSGQDTSVADPAVSGDSELLPGEAMAGQSAEVIEATGGDDFAAQLRGTGGVEMQAAVPLQGDPAVKVQAQPRVHSATDLQQFTFEQISQGVLRGLKNNEHHLTLTLYPKELGEVKVDLQVRGSQLSATFVMENQKVKEAMESNMGDFKDNLERRGFSLQSMSVSVGQQDQGKDSGQRFVAAWEQIVANQNRDTIAVPGAGALEFGPNDAMPLRQGSISLFV